MSAMTVLLAAVLSIQEEKPMNDEDLAKEIVRVWGEVRQAFIDFRLDDVKKHLEIPAGAPAPTREQSKQFGAFLPDLSKGKRLKLERQGKLAGYYVLFEREIAVVRFRETAAGWKPVPGQDTVSSYGGDVPLTDATVRRLLATRGALQLTPTDAEEDLRPEAEVRAELEALAKPVRARFVGLAWAPGRVAYVAEIKPGNVKVTTAGVWRFERKDGAYALQSAEEVELPPTGQAKLLELVGTDPRLTP
jgi:hypothetical protein